ncbi:MAG TPA: HAMP domain-containing sensor histidine kinase [Gemmatimonadales bacterium]|jgi:signal transduction histidine kinase
MRAGRRLTLSTALLGGTLALSVALGWLAARAGSAQRRSANSALHNYADIAAWQYARSGRTALGNALNSTQGFITREFLRPVRGNAGVFSFVAPTRLPGPEMLRRVLAADPCECLTTRRASTVFRITPDNVFALDGDSLSDSTRHELARLALRDSLGWGRRGSRLLPPGIPALGDPHAFVALVRIRLPSPGRALMPESPTTVSAVYGMVLGAPVIAKVLGGAMNDAQVLAPSLLAQMRGTSFVRVRDLAPDGTPLVASPPPADSTFMSSDTLGAAYGGLSVSATLDGPVAARVLLSQASGPGSGAIAALLILTLALGTAALLLLRREQQLVRLRQDFVSGVSHELRTPLTQIRLHSELLLQDGFRSEQERRRAMTVVHRESLRMTNLVDNVLRFARPRRPLDADSAPATPLAPGDVAREVGEMFQPLAAECGANLVVEAADDLRVVADRDAVTRILCNLTENALKYGPRGQTVRVGVAGSNGMVRLTVEDGGPGIPPAERARIWEPYYRLARDRNAPAGGSGLGLAVVAGLVDSLGGRSAVESAPGGGARFVVDLPAGDAA